MKTLSITLEDSEYKKLLEHKKKLKMTWKEYLMKDVCEKS